MYFTLITPASGLEHRAAASRAAAPYTEHQWLWRFFPTPEGEPRDFLFRRADVDGMPRYYVVSARKPVVASDGWDVQVRDYAPRLEEGTRLRFDLRANPVITHKRDGKSKRDDVVMHAKRRLLDERGLRRWEDWQGQDKPLLYDLVRDACADWLKSRAHKSGFAVDESGLRVDGYLQHAEKRGLLRFSTVDYSGTLAVTDPARFGETLLTGIGHAKAFGCGLLLVRPGQ